MEEEVEALVQLQVRCCFIRKLDRLKDAARFDDQLHLFVRHNMNVIFLNLDVHQVGQRAQTVGDFGPDCSVPHLDFKADKVLFKQLVGFAHDAAPIKKDDWVVVEATGATSKTVDTGVNFDEEAQIADFGHFDYGR